jgi:hypothetical protein
VRRFLRHFLPRSYFGLLVVSAGPVLSAPFLAVPCGPLLRLRFFGAVVVVVVVVVVVLVAAVFAVAFVFAGFLAGVVVSVLPDCAIANAPPSITVQTTANSFFIVSPPKEQYLLISNP